MSASALAPGLARKVKKILEIKTESADLTNALKTLSSIYLDNTTGARRQLRSTIEQRGLQINEQFLQAAGSVTQALDDVQGHLDGLSASCAVITSALASAHATAAGLLADSDKAAKELAMLEGKRQAVEQFLDKYQLSPEEVSVLQAGRVGPEFFAALSRVRAIHEHCRGLLRGHHQRAGLELMDQMVAHQEAAYEHLCRWVQAECRSIGEYDAPEVDPTLTAAVTALRDRPVLFRYCAEEVAGARHGALFQRFIVALTRGGPGGLPRPIEIHAHDPRRYVADMLAWVHQALCGEREFVVALFGSGGGSSDDSRTASDSGADGTVSGQQQGAALAESASAAGELLTPAVLLDRIFESVCRPLRVRIEQVLMMSPPLLLCYQLGQLTLFYHSLVVNVLGSKAALSQTLGACGELANRTFLEQLRVFGERMLRTPPPPPPDLTPPTQVTQTLQLLSDIITAYEGSLQHSSIPTSSTNSEEPTAFSEGSVANIASAAVVTLDAILNAVLVPLLEMVKRSAEALSPDSPARLDDGGKLDPMAYRVYIINCMAACQATLAVRPAAAGWAHRIAGDINGQLESLVEQEAGRLLVRAALAEVLERLRLYQASSGVAGAAATALPAADPALSLPVLAEALRKFFVAISSPDALPEFAAIQSPRLRGAAVARVAGSLVAAYEQVYGLLSDPAAGYAEQGGSSSVKHTPAQVRTILGVI